MGALRNDSFRWQLLAFVGAGMALCALAQACSGASAALWAAVSAVVGMALFAAISVARYGEIGRLAAEVDAVLHAHASSRDLDFSDYREGDVAILRNELAKMVSALRDASERARRERGALAEALADVSHQIRTPLTAAMLMLPRIERAKGADRNRILRELEQLLERTGWLVAVLLKLAKADSGTLRMNAQPVDVLAVVGEALAPLELPLDLHGITCELRVASGAAFKGDAAWTAEALGNILKNCMEHTPDGGTITVEAAEDAVATRIRIVDSGPGIAADDLPHVFERFYRGRADAVRTGAGGVGAADADAADADAVGAGGMSAPARTPQGFGIGLALAQSLVQAQGGALRAGNAAGGGAQFDVTFPKGVV